MDEEEVRVVMTIGDAYARPIVDHLEAEGADTHDLSKLLVYGSGGAILSPSLKESLNRLLPHVIVMDGFGASETGGQGSLVGQNEDGAPVFQMGPGNVVIADDGALCAPGDGRMGMLATSGHIPLGYYRDEARTAETFPVIDGVRYAVPGDLAKLLADGTIAVYGRGSVSINSGGEKVFPEEVEKALKSHPAVFDAIVVGTPSDRWGAQVTAVVQLRTGLDGHTGPRGPCASTVASTWRATSCPARRCSSTPSVVRRRASPTTAGPATWPWPLWRAPSPRGRDRYGSVGASTGWDR